MSKPAVYIKDVLRGGLDYPRREEEAVDEFCPLAVLQPHLDDLLTWVGKHGCDHLRVSRLRKKKLSFLKV